MAPKNRNVKKTLPSPTTTTTIHTNIGSGSSTPLLLRKFTSNDIRKMMEYNTELGEGMTEFYIELGEGMTAKVFKGKWEKKEVAIKHYKQGNRSYWEVEKRFFEEYRHPCIVECYGYCNETNWECLVLECMRCSLITKKQGSTAGSSLSKGEVIELDWKTTLRVLIQVTDAVSYINSKGKIIGDLKPDAIMLDKKNNAKLVDFNSIIGDKSLPELVNVGYAAPESFGVSVHPSSDVFSIGTIMLEMLTGEITGPVPKWAKLIAKRAGPLPEDKSKKRHEKQKEIPKPHITEILADRKEFKIRDKLRETGCTGSVATDIVQIAMDSTNYDPTLRLKTDVLLERLQRLASRDQSTTTTTA